MEVRSTALGGRHAATWTQIPPHREVHSRRDPCAPLLGPTDSIRPRGRDERRVVGRGASVRQPQRVLEADSGVVSPPLRLGQERPGGGVPTVQQPPWPLAQRRGRARSRRPCRARKRRHLPRAPAAGGGSGTPSRRSGAPPPPRRWRAPPPRPTCCSQERLCQGHRAGLVKIHRCKVGHVLPPTYQGEPSLRIRLDPGARC